MAAVGERRPRLDRSSSRRRLLPRAARLWDTTKVSKPAGPAIHATGKDDYHVCLRSARIAKERRYASRSGQMMALERSISSAVEQKDCLRTSRPAVESPGTPVAVVGQRLSSNSSMRTNRSQA